MQQTQLRNNYLKNRCNANRKEYNIQRKLRISLARKAKLDYFINITIIICLIK